MLQNGMLLCDTCKKNGIRAPEGATPQTRFTCKDCLSLQPGSGFVPVDYNKKYNYPVGRRIGRMEQNWWNRQCAENRAGWSPSSRLVDAIVKGPDRDKFEAICRMPSEYIERALRKRHRWATFATVENLAGLPPQQLRAFLLVAYLGMTASEASIAMNIAENSVYYYLQMAKHGLVRIGAGVHRSIFSIEKTRPYIKQQPSFVM